MKLRCLESIIYWAQRNAERSDQHGSCKFVPAFIFDHSMRSYSSLSCIMSTSSLTDMPVAPHHVGSSLLGTLASSSSSPSSSNDQPTKFHPSSSIQLQKLSLPSTRDRTIFFFFLHVKKEKLKGLCIFILTLA